MQQVVSFNNWWCWFCLLIAAFLEAAWAFSLRYMQFSRLKELSWHNFYLQDTGWRILWPFAGYVLFGAANVYFFALATKQIPMATAFAVWTGLSLACIKLAEVIFLREKIAIQEILCMAVILAGIIGLKVYNSRA